MVEFFRRELDVPHRIPGVYLGPCPAGAPANLTDALAKLGAGSSLIGVLGDDEFGELLLSRLREDGVDVRHIRVTQGYTTGISFVTYYTSGVRKFIFHLRHSAAGQLSPEDIEEEFIADSELLHIMGSSLAISESSQRACYKAVDIAKDSNLMITFDPNLRPELIDAETIRKVCEPILKVSRVVLLSKNEAAILTGTQDPVRAGERLIEMGPEMAVLKMGDKGAVAVTEEETFFEPPFEVSEVDPTGAGDVYDAAFLYGLTNKWSLSKTMEFASATGAIKVTKLGAMSGPSSIDEVEDFIRKANKKTI